MGRGSAFFFSLFAHERVGINDLNIVATGKHRIRGTANGSNSCQAVPLDQGVPVSTYTNKGGMKLLYPFFDKALEEILGKVL